MNSLEPKKLALLRISDIKTANTAHSRPGTAK